ncbi:MAG: hypothetical protein ONB13_10880 [candidate division KSB1 bacterium]|nr:hypothetical protein [candidate division KSB1 bacterium]MDZ7334395.1 hypothetical protein [candidate division KSB1 bacterium]MDZ7358168.1 hypothetical protein [candidate division KSB1 bacterium]MDZ7377115.1 hypothetical protein [candidate division KSB1 bacterium]MDZ7398798.1 hypothetical protein [candidate division KSB1 bacterium]
MAVKFNEYWNIVPTSANEYVDFMKRSRIPTLNRLGINVVAIWCVLIGGSPQIISEGIAENLDQIENALKSDEYARTATQLLHFVTDYKSKVMVPTGRFQHLPRVTEKGTVKFSQYWDVIPGKEHQYDQFIKNDFYPAMEAIGIHVAGEWKVLIGESPNMFFEGRCDHAEQLLTALNSQKFRTMKHELMKWVTNYSSRVLVFHAFRAKGATTSDYEFYFI